MPGVSTRITCDEPMSAMPRTGPRVVCALWVTIDTLAPTSALVRVDLPLFGAPIRATKPQRAGASLPCSTGAVSPSSLPRLALAIMWGPPDTFAQQHGKRRRLLGGALIGSLPPLRRHAVDLHLGGEARRGVGPLAGDFEITRQRQPPSLRPFLEHGFGIGRRRLDLAEMRFPEATYNGARRLIARIGEDRAKHRLAGVGEDRLLAAPAAQRLAAAHQDEVAELPRLRHLGAGLGAHEIVEPAGKLALIGLGEMVGQDLGDRKSEHPVAKEFEAFVVLVRLAARARAGMGQRELQQSRI